VRFVQISGELFSALLFLVAGKLTDVLISLYLQRSYQFAFNLSPQKLPLFFTILFYHFAFTYMCMPYLVHLPTLPKGKICSALLFSNFVEEKP
jgi:hypothetical protein